MLENFLFKTLTVYMQILPDNFSHRGLQSQAQMNDQHTGTMMYV